MGRVANAHLGGGKKATSEEGPVKGASAILSVAILSGRPLTDAIPAFLADAVTVEVPTKVHLATTEVHVDVLRLATLVPTAPNVVTVTASLATRETVEMLARLQVVHFNSATIFVVFLRGRIYRPRKSAG